MNLVCHLSVRWSWTLNQCVFFLGHFVFFPRARVGLVKKKSDEKHRKKSTWPKPGKTSFKQPCLYKPENLVYMSHVERTRGLNIFLHLRSETWTQWTTEAARVKVHPRPYSFEDGPVVYSANGLTLVCEVIRYCLVQVRQNLKKKKKEGLNSLKHTEPKHVNWQRYDTQ